MFPGEFDNSFAAPVNILAVAGGATLLPSEYKSKGRAFANFGTIFVQGCAPEVLTGNYSFQVEFELTCRLDLV